MSPKLCPVCQMQGIVVTVRHDGEAVDGFCGRCFRQWAQMHREILPAQLPTSSRCATSHRTDQALLGCPRAAAVAVTSLGSGWTLYCCTRCLEHMAEHY